MNRPYTILIYLILLCCCSTAIKGQSNIILDKEKLLELYQAQRYTEAAGYLQTVYHEDTEDQKEIAQMAYANMMAGNLPIAEKYYMRLYGQDPGSLSVLFNLASISRRRGDDVKAKFYYKEIIKIDSLNFNVYKQLAGMIDIPIDPEKIAYLKKANYLSATNPDVAFDLANSLNLSKKNDSAYTVIQTALIADTLNIMLLKAKLPICIALKKLDEAIFTGDKLLQSGDSSSYVLNNMGKAYFITKQYEKSLLMFKIIEEMGQKNESTLYYTALCYRELKNLPLATGYMKQAIQEAISPFMSNYYKVLGEIYEKNSQINNATISYNKSLDYNNNGEVYYNLALLNDHKLNNKKAALKFYNKFLLSKPDAEKYKAVIPYVKSRITAIR